MHALAEESYRPALPLYIAGLDDPDWEWRQNYLNLIGFHYALPPTGRVVKKIQAMLAADPGGDGEVRRTAASVLGIRSTWLDAALIAALQAAPDISVRQAAFAALLKLAGVPRRRVLRIEVSMLRKEYDDVSVEALKTILREEGLERTLP